MMVYNCNVSTGKWRQESLEFEDPVIQKVHSQIAPATTALKGRDRMTATSFCGQSVTHSEF